MNRWVDVMQRDWNSPIHAKPSVRARTMKRREAEHRNDATRPDRTRAHRLALDADALYDYMRFQHFEWVGDDCPLDSCPYL